ncbi:MFS transporter [Aeromicrobium camelliae]|uniref:MFS transporter n=1 Tax=Aeromicrobium camelliae TaxID=1538144 RepID=A0A3N6WKD0_9ACTN|nr:MFS transporter [Aeromicrobium camelliae]RQN08046.1 MFS transporter [Aeromicrobium camelliae]
MTAVESGVSWRTAGLSAAVAGLFTTAFLVAFESLAVATALPIVADDLDGLSLYAVSFAAPAATAVAAMTVAAWCCDRYGHAPVMVAGVLVFALGLVVAGVASTMTQFVVGRAVQGVGSGLIGVALYVLVGRTFPPELRPRAFVVLTSAWVLPAVVGPAVAGTVAEHVGWRWVFLGVPVLAFVALALLRPALATSHGDASVVADRGRVWRSLVVAASVFAVTIGGQRTVAWWPLLVLGGAVVALASVVALLPPGTFRARPGLPSVIATRSLTSTAFFVAESFVPLGLVQLRGLSPTVAGLFLTATAVLWFAGSWWSTRSRWWRSRRRRVVVGAAAVVVAVVAASAVVIDAVPIAVIAAGWAFGGLGMGMAMPTLSVLVLDLSTPDTQGRNSASMQTSDAVLQALVIAVCSGVFAALLAQGGATPFVGVFAIAAVVAVVAVPVATRVGPDESR